MKDGCLDIFRFDEEVVSFEDVMDVNMQWENFIDEALIPDASNHPQLAHQFVNSVDNQTMYIMTPIHYCLTIGEVDLHYREWSFYSPNSQSNAVDSKMMVVERVQCQIPVHSFMSNESKEYSSQQLIFTH